MIFRAALTAMSGRTSMSLVLFLRNIIVARLLSPEDFGIAATFAIAFTFVELGTTVGTDRMIVRDIDGDKPSFMATMHSMQMLRGVIGALVMVGLAYPYAHLMKVPDIVWAYQLMALVPLVRGLLHFDLFRLQRHMKFGAFSISQTLSPLLSIMVAGLTYLITPDYQIMLWAILTHQTLLVIFSHIFAEQRYQWGWERAVVKRSLRFGIPLFFNGALLFIIMQADRLIIGNQFGLEALGWFSIAFLITFTPSQVLASTLSSLLLPALSKIQNEPAAFHATAQRGLELGVLLGVSLMVFIACVGPALITVFFGRPYVESLDVLLILAVISSIRVCRGASTTVAIARGFTTNALYANLARCAAVPVGLLTVLLGADIQQLLVVALFGEVLAFSISLWLLRSRLEIPILSVAPGLTLLLLAGGTILAMQWLFPPGIGLAQNFNILHLVLGIELAAAVFAFRELRHWLILRHFKRASHAK